MTRPTPINYPLDVLTQNPQLDVINSQEAGTLDELFRERVRRSSNKAAYSQYDVVEKCWYQQTWAEIAHQVERWQVAFLEQGLKKGDRVAICHRNSIEWVIFDQAALRLGLVIVPLYTVDRVDNTAYIIANAGAKLVLFSKASSWAAIAETDHDLSAVQRVLVFADGAQSANRKFNDETDGIIKLVSDWLPEQPQHLERGMCGPDDLASIVYTSGTTGRPKGVMLSHRNMLANAYAGLRSVAVTPDDTFLSFLPLSHTLERTVGYYAVMMAGAQVTFNRSIAELSKDLAEVKPTVMVSVPRIFERVHNQIYNSLKTMSPLKRSLFKRAIKTGWQRFERDQGVSSWHPRLLLANLLDRAVAQTVRDKLGGRLKFVVVGGAPLSADVAKTFISLGIPLLQGYGLTEASPIVSVNTLEQNRPDSIGLPLRGVEIKIMDKDELWVRGDNVMLGYWLNDQATNDVTQGEWLKTGDRASIDEQGFIRIIGRIKDILVLANGENVPPSDIEAAISRDTLFEQVMVLGEGKPYLTALLMLDQEQWSELVEAHPEKGIELGNNVANSLLLSRVTAQMKAFPGYARIRRIYATTDEWAVDNGLLTPTLKMKRGPIAEHYKGEIKEMYAGHGVQRW